MKSLILFSAFLMTTSAFASSKTLLQCAAGKIKGSDGVRINLIQADDGSLKANLIFGTTNSGTAYHVEETSPGLYEGEIKGKSQFPFRLQVSKKEDQNKYISGNASSLRATYPTVLNSKGYDTVETSTSDDFVCGKQIAPFSN